MRYLLLACDIFTREARACAARSPHALAMEFLPLGEHAYPERLRARLQARIDAAAAAPEPCDAVLLLFGLCGNATAGLIARGAPLVLPRAHDCATILLGSKAAFQRHFGENPSQGFSSNGYLERGEGLLHEADATGEAYAELVRRHGEENARYVWETLHPPRPDAKAVFIRMPGIDDASHAARFRARAESAGRRCELLTGDLRLIAALVEGRWSPDEFLVVPPGQTIAGVYDADEVVRVMPV